MNDYIKREDAIVRLWKQLRRLSDIIPMGKDAAGVAVRIIEDLPAADVVKGAACKECRFRNVCQQEIKMLGPGIVYEYSLKIEGCSLGERMKVRTNECK